MQSIGKANTFSYIDVDLSRTFPTLAFFQVGLKRLIRGFVHPHSETERWCAGMVTGGLPHASAAA